ncbi:MAG TPA: efflux RND transporter periplasmic adaptor subunit [Steroidobacteraceae bacterium]|nr:efflux RND transporter periplasmic adaptor subunit [Steroidobacteraceae bacterium]
MHCDFNTKVRKGQLCAKIDPRPYLSVVQQSQANLAQAQAQLGKDRANLAFTQQVYERDANLLERGIISQETADTAKNAYQQAQAQIALDAATIEQHQAALTSARVNLGYTDIISPVDGIVVSRNVTQGQTVASSFQTPTLFLIANDLTKMQVDTNVSESDIGGVAMGNSATFRVEAYPERPFSGAVVQVRQAPQTVQNVVTYDVVIGVDNPELQLKPGMTAATRIFIKRHENVLRVPNQALHYLPGGLAAAGRGSESHVWVLRDGTPVQISVVTGLEDDTYTEIVKGELSESDKVIVSEEKEKETNNAPDNRSGPRLPRM